MKNLYLQVFIFSEYIPKKSGYKFVGWNNINESVIYYPGDKFAGNFDVEFWAIWEKYELCSLCNGSGETFTECTECYGDIDYNCEVCGSLGYISNTCSLCLGTKGIFEPTPQILTKSTSNTNKM